MPTPVLSAVEKVRAERTLDDMAFDIDTVIRRMRDNGAESDAKILRQLQFDYGVLLAARAAYFQESALQMQTPVRPGATALNALRAKVQEDGVIRGLLPIVPDRGFVQGEMPADLMPSMERGD